MAGSQVAWLNFDQDQQQRTQLLMAALSQQGTVDELGMGILRDLISGVLFPGHTVLHSRAKYLLFIPRDFAGLRGSTADAISKAARRAEGDRITRLRRHYEPDLRNKGIIGYTTGSETKQMPSGSYWGLLRQLGIYKAKGSIWDYYATVAAERAALATRTMFHSEDEHVQSAAALEMWADMPDPDVSFGGFDLSPDEATWLRDRFLLSDQEPDESRSLVTWLLDPGRAEWVENLRSIGDHPQADQFPARTAEAMELGRDADDIVFGARVLYNYLCAVGRPDDSEEKSVLVTRYEDAMKDWTKHLELLPGLDRLNELEAWARGRLDDLRASQPARMRWALTLGFLRRWLQNVQASSDLLKDPDAEATITRREASLKPGRARLVQRDRLRNWEGNSGYFRMDYNWGPTRRLLDDIHRGLGTPRVQAPDSADDDLVEV